jgi:hypothetical protein
MVASLEISTLLNVGVVMSCHVGAPSCPTCLAQATACRSCSTAFGFGGVTHGDNDGEPTGSASNGLNEKRSRAKDGLGGVAHGVSNGETIDGANEAPLNVAPTMQEVQEG